MLLLSQLVSVILYGNISSFTSSSTPISAVVLELHTKSGHIKVQTWSLIFQVIPAVILVKELVKFTKQWFLILPYLKVNWRKGILPFLITIKKNSHGYFTF